MPEENKKETQTKGSYFIHDRFKKKYPYYLVWFIRYLYDLFRMNIKEEDV